MGEPVSITRKLDELRESIKSALSTDGSAQAEVEKLDIDVDQWRKLARAAARELGRPVETVATTHHVWAALRDWPATPEEEAKNFAAMRAAMELVSLKTAVRPKLVGLPRTHE